MQAYNLTGKKLDKGLKSLKIPKGLSEAVNRRTDNTLVTKKKDRKTNAGLLKHYTEN